MSATAWFYVLDRKHLPEFVRSPAEVLGNVGRRLPDAYGWSGYCVAHVLEYLADRGVALIESEHDGVLAELGEDEPLTVLLTPEHRRFIPQLDPAAYRDEDLVAHFEEADYAFDEAPAAARDAIALFRDQLATLGDEEVLVIQVG